MAEVNRFMKALENRPPNIPGMSAVEKRDYSLGQSWNLVTGLTYELTLPKAKVLHYRFSDNSWVCVRPSGTEPKLKIYLSAAAPSNEEAERKITSLKKAVLANVEG